MFTNTIRHILVKFSSKLRFSSSIIIAGFIGIIITSCEAPATNPSEDRTLDGLSLTKLENQKIATLISSEEITITYIDSETPVSVSGSPSARFSINDGDKIVSGTVSDGDKLKLYLTTPETYSTTTTVSLTVGTLKKEWIVITKDKDRTPDGFSLAKLENQKIATSISSEEITITGTNPKIYVSVSGSPSARFSINDGDKIVSGTISNGDKLKLYLTTPETYSTTTTVSLAVGTLKKEWIVITKDKDRTPDGFSLAKLENQKIATPISSEEITITGTNPKIYVSVSGSPSARFSINDGDKIVSGTVSDGDKLKLYLTTPETYSTTTTVSLTVGTLKKEWIVITKDKVIINFIAQTSTPSVLITSNKVSIFGIDSPSDVSISGDSTAKYKINDGKFTNDSGKINDGDSMTLQVESSADSGGIKKVIIKIGTISTSWTITTITKGSPSITGIPYDAMDISKQKAFLFISGQSNTERGVTVSAKGGSFFKNVKTLRYNNINSNVNNENAWVWDNFSSSFTYNLGRRTGGNIHTQTYGIALGWQEAINAGVKLPDLYIVQVSHSSFGFSTKSGPSYRPEFGGFNPTYDENPEPLYRDVPIERFWKFIPRVHRWAINNLIEGGNVVRHLGLFWNQFEHDVAEGDPTDYKAFLEEFLKLFDEDTGFQIPLFHMYPRAPWFKTNPKKELIIQKAFDEIKAERAYVVPIDVSQNISYNSADSKNGVFVDGFHYKTEIIRDFISKIPIDYFLGTTNTIGKNGSIRKNTDFRDYGGLIFETIR